jgi:hypothetical protein
MELRVVRVQWIGSLQGTAGATQLRIAFSIQLYTDAGLVLLVIKTGFA